MDILLTTSMLHGRGYVPLHGHCLHLRGVRWSAGGAVKPRVPDRLCKNGDPFVPGRLRMS